MRAFWLVGISALIASGLVQAKQKSPSMATGAIATTVSHAKCLESGLAALEQESVLENTTKSDYSVAAMSGEYTAVIHCEPGYAFFAVSGPFSAPCGDFVNQLARSFSFHSKK